MPLFAPSALRALRALNRKSLDSVAVIEAPAIAGAPGGGANTGKRGWAVVDGGDAVPCRLSNAEAGTVVIQAGQSATPDRFLLVVDLEGPVIADGYRVTVTGVDIAGQAWQRVVSIVSAFNPRTNSAMRAFVVQDVSPSGS